MAAHLAYCGVALEVVEVHPGLTCEERSKRRGAGKAHPGDAVAIGRVTARELGLLPVRLTIGPAADLRNLLDYRADLRANGPLWSTASRLGSPGTP